MRYLADYDEPLTQREDIENPKTLGRSDYDDPFRVMVYYIDIWDPKGAKADHDYPPYTKINPVNVGGADHDNSPYTRFNSWPVGRADTDDPMIKRTLFNADADDPQSPRSFGADVDPPGTGYLN